MESTLSGLLSHLDGPQLVGLLGAVSLCSALLTLLLAALRYGRREATARLREADLAGRLEESGQEQQRLLQQLDDARGEVRNWQDRFESERQRAESLERSLHEGRARLEAAGQRHGELQQRHEALESRLESLQHAHAELQRRHAELETTLEERDRAHQQQVEQFNVQKKELAREFENLANRIFEEKGRSFTQTSQAGIDAMLKPFREQIDGFQKRVNEIHDHSVTRTTQLAGEIQRVLDIGLQMSQEANNLTSALKGDAQQRGAWGEAQLERTLQLSGLVEHDHYESQTSFKDDAGKARRTDYLVKLPDGKHIIIDSKVSLVAYERAVAADSDEARTLAMEEHVRAVRRHIDDLAAKDYTTLAGVRSPSFVLMFMPIEPAYIDALRTNRDLFNYGYEKGIVLVSHTTLIPILRTVANLWMLERSNAEAREISERAGDIFNQVCLVAERLQKLGGTLGTASNHYNETVRALAGRQGLYGKVERFGTLSNRVSRDLPALEPAHMDFESERLAMVAEPVPDAPQQVAEDGDETGKAQEANTTPGDPARPLTEA